MESNEFLPFLRQVAHHYATDSEGRPSTPRDIAKLCFVFPNRRSAFFFSQYFKDEVKKLGVPTFITPKTTTFSSLVADWCGLIEARHEELLLLLFKTYVDLASGNCFNKLPAALEPERFIYWCDLILNDFNDVDMACANAAHLYRNLKDLKELQTNPLGPEEIKLIRRFWDLTGVPWIDNADENSRMWVFQSPNDDKLRDGVRHFLRLWEVLGPLYDKFNEELLKQGLCYQGMAYRRAARNLKEAQIDGFKLEKLNYIFVGFSFLNRSEKEIMRVLQKEGKATFFWDTTLPKINLGTDFPLRLINKYVKEFPSPPEFNLVIPSYSPQITIYSVPSDFGQVSQAASILNSAGHISTEEAVKHAIVLPEKNLCLSLIDSIESSRQVNISIGYPLKDTPIAALMALVTDMRSRADMSGGKRRFNRHTIIPVISDPLLLRNCAAECRNLMALISAERRLYIPQDLLLGKAGKLACLFEMPQDGNIDDSLDSFTRLIDNLTQLCVDTEAPHDLGADFLGSYRHEVRDIRNLIAKYNLSAYLAKSDDSVYLMMEKILNRLTLSFAGTPLKGIQMMGVLETRGLDFETVIITSMNERIFPRKLMKESFIPQILRHAYGLDNHEDEESVMAYHFYRLIGRARNVHLLYNSDTDGLKSGEASRYIYQLIYLCNCPSIKQEILNYTTWTPPQRSVSIKKTPVVMEQLQAYRPDFEGKKKYLSASSIKKYLTCPLDFYLSSVCGFADEDSDLLHIDDSVFGTITHSIMNEIYNAQPVMKWRGKEYPKITIAVIDAILASDIIDRAAIRAINSDYYRRETEDNDDSEGEAKIFKDMAVKSVRRLLEAERVYMTANNIAYFLVLEAEKSRKTTLHLEGLPETNFKFVIDRLDRVFTAGGPDNDGYYRIVDYKTGGDTLIYNGVDSLVKFSVRPNEGFPKAITQLMLYSIAFAALKDYDVKKGERIQPMIYSFRDIAQTGAINPIYDKKSKSPLDDYTTIVDEFKEKITLRLTEIFDTTSPFSQTTDTKNCTYCAFREICKR